LRGGSVKKNKSKKGEDREEEAKGCRPAAERTTLRKGTAFDKEKFRTTTIKKQKSGLRV